MLISREHVKIQIRINCSINTLVPNSIPSLSHLSPNSVCRSHAIPVMSSLVYVYFNSKWMFAASFQLGFFSATYSWNAEGTFTETEIMFTDYLIRYFKLTGHTISYEGKIDFILTCINSGIILYYYLVWRNYMSFAI